jgi:lysophospholipase L1-like esterase
MNSKHAAVVLGLAFLCFHCPDVLATPENTSDGLYVALGDSITAGTGVANSCKPFPNHPVDINIYCPSGTSYPILTAKVLRASGVAKKFMNLGIPGATIDRVISDELPYLPANTTLVTLYIGTNDSRQFGTPKYSVDEAVIRYERQYEELLSSIHMQAPQARIVLINIPNEKELGMTYHLTDVVAERFDQTSQRMTRFINGHYPKFAVVDTICDPKSYIVEHRYKGSVHPSELGAADLAKSLLDVLLAATPPAPPSSCQWLSPETGSAAK